MGTRMFAIVKDMLKSVYNLNEMSLSDMLEAAFEMYPVRVVCADIIAPMMWEIGSMWERGEIMVVMEHFASNVIITKLKALLHKQNTTTNSKGPVVIVGCAPEEFHEIGALIVSFFMSLNGWKVVYLGQNVPPSDIMNIVDTMEVHTVAMSASTERSLSSLKLIGSHIASRAKHKKVEFMVGGRLLSAGENILESIPAATTRTADELYAYCPPTHPTNQDTMVRGALDGSYSLIRESYRKMRLANERRKRTQYLLDQIATDGAGADKIGELEEEELSETMEKVMELARDSTACDYTGSGPTINELPDSPSIEKDSKEVKKVKGAKDAKEAKEVKEATGVKEKEAKEEEAEDAKDAGDPKDAAIPGNAGNVGDAEGEEAKADRNGTEETEGGKKDVAVADTGEKPKAAKKGLQNGKHDKGAKDARNGTKTASTEEIEKNSVKDETKATKSPRGRKEKTINKEETKDTKSTKEEMKPTKEMNGKKEAKHTRETNGKKETKDKGNPKEVKERLEKGGDAPRLQKIKSPNTTPGTTPPTSRASPFSISPPASSPTPNGTSSPSITSSSSPSITSSSSPSATSSASPPTSSSPTPTSTTSTSSLSSSTPRSTSPIVQSSSSPIILSEKEKEKQKEKDKEATDIKERLEKQRQQTLAMKEMLQRYKDGKKVAEQNIARSRAFLNENRLVSAKKKPAPPPEPVVKPPSHPPATPYHPPKDENRLISNPYGGGPKPTTTRFIHMHTPQDAATQALAHAHTLRYGDDEPYYPKYMNMPRVGADAKGDNSSNSSTSMSDDEQFEDGVD